MTDSVEPATPRRGPLRRSGKEKFQTGGAPSPSLRDFWAWSSSDLLSNSLRGVLAEFIVGTALGCIGDDDTRIEWDAFDLIADGVLIEVKSTAYLQTWGPSKPDSLRFGISKTRAWDARTNTYDTESKRQAAVYVFCVFTSREAPLADPMNVSNWDFYVCTTNMLNSQFPTQKSVSLAALLRTNFVRQCTFLELLSTVAKAAQ